MEATDSLSRRVTIKSEGNLALFMQLVGPQSLLFYFIIFYYVIPLIYAV